MRIIAGEFRGRKLLSPESDTTRPITDRVKQSLFDMLSPRIEGARVYDVFAGTGSMGLECLSRQAVHATFFERDRSAGMLLRKNIASLGVSGRSTVVAVDLFKWFETQSTRNDASRIDLIFLDPPYRMLNEQADALQRLALHLANDHLADDGLVIFRHDAKDRLDLPALQCHDVRTYGGMIVELLTHPGT